MHNEHTALYTRIDTMATQYIQNGCHEICVLAALGMLNKTDLLSPSWILMLFKNGLVT